MNIRIWRAMIPLTVVTALSVNAQTGADDSKELPVLEFKGYRTDTPNDHSTRRCNQNDEVEAKVPAADRGLQECDPRFEMLAGHGSFMILSFYHGRLNALRAAPVDDAHADVLAALTMKYGAPCSSETKIVRTMVGAAFDNVITKWCFRGGDLELHSISTRLNTSELLFVDRTNQPPPEVPDVDF